MELIKTFMNLLKSSDQIYPRLHMGKLGIWLRAVTVAFIPKLLRRTRSSIDNTTAIGCIIKKLSADRVL